MFVGVSLRIDRCNSHLARTKLPATVQPSLRTDCCATSARLTQDRIGCGFHPLFWLRWLQTPRMEAPKARPVKAELGSSSVHYGEKLTLGQRDADRIYKPLR